jgi:hypothetical protein
MGRKTITLLHAHLKLLEPKTSGTKAVSRDKPTEETEETGNISGNHPVRLSSNQPS